jgi:hypothetical protein
MADKSNNWAMVDLSARDRAAELVLRVGVGGTQIPISQFSMSYGLNDIPKATALVALGRDARTGEPSPIYEQIAEIKQMAAARVFIRGNLGDWSPRGIDGSKESFPIVSDATIFIGYVSGTSYRRSAGRVSLVLNLVNQLVDLSLSSGGSKDVVPGSPSDLMLPLGLEGSGSGTAADKFSDELRQDLDVDFSEGVLKVLHNLSINNQIQPHDAEIWCEGPDGPISEIAENGMAASVIEGKGRWQGINNWTGLETDVSEYVEKYPLLVAASAVEKAATAIGAHVTSSLAGTSMWSMLIGSMLSDFGCGVIPWAAGAIVAPILTMARDAQMVLKAGEYVDFDLSTMSQRPLYGVGVLGSFQMGTINDSANAKVCAGSSFIAKTDENIPLNDGMWMFVGAPRWMDDWVNFDPKAAVGEADINKTLSQPSHDATGIDEAAIKRNPGEEVKVWNDAMKQYAQMIYASNALRGREGTVVGKLRFDIAPGTTIMIQAKGDKYLDQLQYSDAEELSEGVDTLATDMYGFVAKVHISINAEQASATTAFELTNLRTEAENEQISGRFSMPEHPFFGPSYFKYAPLVPGLTVPEEAPVEGALPIVGIGVGSEGDETNPDVVSVDATGLARILGPIAGGIPDIDDNFPLDDAGTQRVLSPANILATQLSPPYNPALDVENNPQPVDETGNLYAGTGGGFPLPEKDSGEAGQTTIV